MERSLQEAHSTILLQSLEWLCLGRPLESPPIELPHRRSDALLPAEYKTIEQNIGRLGHRIKHPYLLLLNRFGGRLIQLRSFVRFFLMGGRLWGLRFLEGNLLLHPNYRVGLLTSRLDYKNYEIRHPPLTNHEVMEENQTKGNVLLTLSVRQLQEVW